MSYDPSVDLPDPRSRLPFLLPRQAKHPRDAGDLCLVLVAGGGAFSALVRRYGADMAPLDPATLAGGGDVSREGGGGVGNVADELAGGAAGSTGKFALRLGPWRIVDADATTASLAPAAAASAAGSAVGAGAGASGGKLSLRRGSRLVKILPQLFFPRASATVFFDWKLLLAVDPRALVAHALTARAVAFAAWRHPCTTAYASRGICVARGGRRVARPSTASAPAAGTEAAVDGLKRGEGRSVQGWSGFDDDTGGLGKLPSGAADVGDDEFAADDGSGDSTAADDSDGDGDGDGGGEALINSSRAWGGGVQRRPRQRSRSARDGGVAGSGGGPRGAGPRGAGGWWLREVRLVLGRGKSQDPSAVAKQAEAYLQQR